MSDSEYRVVDDYVTSESESEDEVHESNKKKRTRKNWIYERTFDDQEASKDWLDNEKIWSSLKSSETEAGLSVDYRCNLVKRKEPQCAAAIYLLYKKNIETDLQIPTEKQLYNYLAQYRKRKGNTRMNFNELYAWCTENIAIPTNENEPFLSSYQIKVDSCKYECCTILHSQN
ncbi:hypothetical protein BpHYR1_045868 [Brachionus plicatilis]|uniref:Uncharacterized protein n=1 Tax=Brachionus plicatilis TaxID=10195 RepID=A0A3M7RDY2_BRAPC|nr:hypothetical protein BpHYR1_045868 [Brachionus plicatilis]